MGERSHTHRRMFSAFIFQDALRFKISGEDIIVDVAEAIENCRCGESKGCLNAYHDLLIRHHEVEAPDLSVKSAPFPSAEEDCIWREKCRR